MLAGGVVVVSPIALINSIASGWFTKEMQSFLVIELNLNVSASSGKVSFLSGLIDSSLACGHLLFHSFEGSGQPRLHLSIRAHEAVP